MWSVYGEYDLPCQYSTNKEENRVTIFSDIRYSLWPYT